MKQERLVFSRRVLIIWSRFNKYNELLKCGKIFERREKYN